MAIYGPEMMRGVCLLDRIEVFLFVADVLFTLAIFGEESKLAFEYLGDD